MKKNIISSFIKSKYSYSMLSKGVHIVLGILGTIIINRYLGVELKGEYAYIINIVNILFTIFNLGIYQSYPMNKRKNMENITFLYINLMLKQFLLYSFIGIIFFLIYILLNGFNYNTTILIISYIYLLLNILSHQISMITAVESFKTKSKALIAAESFQFILLILMFIFFKENIIILICINILYFILYIYLCFRKLNVKIDLKYKNKEFTIDTLKKGFFPTLFTLFLSLNYRLDLIFLKQYIGVTDITMKDIGLYSVGMQLAQYVWIIPDTFKEVLFNKTSKKDSVNDIVYCSKISILISLFVLLIFCLFGEQIITFLYGKEFAGCIIITKIMFIGVISMCIFKILNPLYNAKGLFFENFIILFISIILNVIFNFILIPPYGSVGAAIASVIGYSVCSIIYLLRFKKEYNIKIKDILFFNRADIKIIKEFVRRNK